MSLAGGLNDNDPPISLKNDACTIAENIEFFNSNLGERRQGCVGITLPASITADANIQAVTWMGKHNPTNTLGDAELWVLAQNLTTATNLLTRRTSTAWSTVTQNDAITSTTGLGHRLSAVSLHGKLFLAHKSSVDQLHVWDGTTLRKTSLGVSAAPTGANTGGGALTGTRFYRVRYVVVSGSAVLLRAEPSAVLTFAPSGAGSAIRVTKPAAISQGETHWELEASTDNANFYRIARTLVGTTTVDDSVVYAVGYALTGTLSEAATAYTQLPSGKFLSIDSDRLIIGGSWENSVYASRIWWTPVFGDPGTGNDERLDMTVNPYVDLDGYEGGEITGLSRAVNGYLYAFKWSHIYKLVRTGNRANAYNAIPITKARGALPGSLVEAVDQAGAPAQYFLDPVIGPMRIGANGLEWVGGDIRNTWMRVNLTATTVSHGVFYQNKNQVHFWVAVDGADYPNFKIVLHCDEVQSSTDGSHRGWVTVPVGNRISNAHCSLMFSSNIDTTSARNQALVPFIGKEQWTVSASTVKNLIQRCDTGTTDCFTAGDTTAYYYARVQSKPFVPASLLNNHGLMSAVLMSLGITDPGNRVYIEAVQDFGVLAKKVGVDLSPDGLETIVIKRIDNFGFSGLTAVQFTFGDLNLNIFPSTSWALHAFMVKISGEQTS